MPDQDSSNPSKPPASTIPRIPLTPPTQLSRQAAEDRAFYREAVGAMPPRTKLELARESAAQQNMDWLNALASDGFFKIGPIAFSEPRKADAMFAPNEFPALAALACVLNNKGTAIHHVDLDGRKLRNAYHVNSISIGQEFADFLTERLNEFRAECTALDATSDIRFKGLLANRANDTYGVLLAVACAADNADMVRDICTAAPKSMHTNLCQRIRSEIPGSWNDLVAPIVLAVEFNAIHALDALREAGTRPGWSVIERAKRDHSPWPEPRHRAPHDESISLAQIMGNNDYTILPSVLGRMVTMLRDKKTGEIETFLSDQLLEVAHDFMDLQGDDSNMDAIDALINAGVYRIDITKSAIEAAKHVYFPVLESLKADIQQRWHLFDGDDFLPTLTAKNSLVPDHREEIEEVTVTLCKWAIEAGHGDMLRHGNSPETAKAYPRELPLNVFAEIGFDNAVLACIQAGADPRRKDRAGVCAMDVATTAGRDSTLRIMAASIARQIAQEVLDNPDVDASNAYFASAP